MAAAFIALACTPASARPRPAPAANLTHSIHGDGVRMSWTTPRQDFAVRYYVDVCRWEHGGWLRIFGTYVRQPPFTLAHPRPATSYAWRVLSVDAEDARNFTPTAWRLIKTGRLGAN